MQVHPPIYALLAQNGLYGIRLQSGTEVLEAAELTADRQKALQLLQLFQENTVYAENFYEILDDLLGTVIW